MAQNTTCRIGRCKRPAIVNHFCDEHQHTCEPQDKLFKNFMGRCKVCGRVMAVLTPAERFWKFVNKTDSCWLWVGTKILPNGYGQFRSDTSNYHYVHRFSYQLAHGEIPKNLTVDHLCRVRHCVNPAHLEAVTHRINTLRGINPAAANARKTHCKRGHEFTAENTRITSQNSRLCRECERLRRCDYYAACVELGAGEVNIV